MNAPLPPSRVYAIIPAIAPHTTQSSTSSPTPTLTTPGSMRAEINWGLPQEQAVAQRLASLLAADYRAC